MIWAMLSFLMLPVFPIQVLLHLGLKLLSPKQAFVLLLDEYVVR